jgi:ribosomal protein S6--L-glutamate ligase
MILSFHPCLDADAQIILGDQPLSRAHLDLISVAEAIILPQSKAIDLYLACSRSGALVFPSYEMRLGYPGKTGQSLLFKKYRIPHPETLRWKTVQELCDTYPDSLDFPHSLPFLIKHDTRHEGEGVFFVEDRPDLETALDRLVVLERSGQRGFVTQEYVPCGGNVLRAVIIGKRILTYWKRPQRPGTVVTTIGRGALIDHQWLPELQEKGRARAQDLSIATGINLAAIDFVFSFSKEDPDPLALEINYYFARRGLGGTKRYYSLLFEAVVEWLDDAGIDPASIRLV